MALLGLVQESNLVLNLFNVRVHHSLNPFPLKSVHYDQVYMIFYNNHVTPDNTSNKKAIKLTNSINSTIPSGHCCCFMSVHPFHYYLKSSTLPVFFSFQLIWLVADYNYLQVSAAFVHLATREKNYLYACSP